MKAHARRRNQKGFFSDAGMALVGLFTGFAMFLLIMSCVFQTVNHVPFQQLSVVQEANSLVAYCLRL